MPYGADAVDQFQVVTSGGQAELDRALGGYFSVVTRSGTNALHGDADGYFRDDALNAANRLNHEVLPMDLAGWTEQDGERAILRTRVIRSRH
jgi:hypothetical protein